MIDEGLGVRIESLGLYLVRLIAEFHGGQAFATNTVDGVRIGFTISDSLEQGTTDDHI